MVGPMVGPAARSAVGAPVSLLSFMLTDSCSSRRASNLVVRESRRRRNGNRAGRQLGLDASPGAV
jgi:hypothetical protein